MADKPDKDPRVVNASNNENSGDKRKTIATIKARQVVADLRRIRTKQRGER